MTHRRRMRERKREKQTGRELKRSNSNTIFKAIKRAAELCVRTNYSFSNIFYFLVDQSRLRCTIFVIYERLTNLLMLAEFKISLIT